MLDRKLSIKISNKLLSSVTKTQMKLEVGRYIEEDPLIDDILKIWIVKLNERQLHERSVELSEYPEISVQLTFAPPKFFSDVVRGEVDVPFWQVATVVRSLNLAHPVYDPEYFIERHKESVKNIKWSPELIEEKKQVTELLLQKAEKYGFKEDMLADGFMWAIKAAEEAICIPLMKKGLFGLSSPILLLDTLRQERELYDFYLQLLGVDILNPDLVMLTLKELENLAEHLFRANEKNERSAWILGSFVSINQAERKLNNIFISAGQVDSLDLQNRFEDVLAELWHGFWLLAQTPGNKITPLDPWVVGLTWKWIMSYGDSNGLTKIIGKVRNILETGTISIDP